MNRVTWHFYDEQTGIFAGRTLSVPLGCEAMLASNTPPGHKAHDCSERPVDHLRHRLDLVTGKVIDYQPACPSAEHVWDETHKHWKLNDAAMAREDRRKTALNARATLEAQSPKLLREAQLGRPGAQARLEQLDKDIQAQEEIIDASSQAVTALT